MSDAAPKLEELAPNGGSKTERAEGDTAMAVDDAKSGSKANGAEGAEGETGEGKQDLKKIEDEFTQLKEKFFAEKLAAIKVEIEQIELGTFRPLLSSSPSFSSFPPLSPASTPFTPTPLLVDIRSSFVLASSLSFHLHKAPTQLFFPLSLRAQKAFPSLFFCTSENALVDLKKGPFAFVSFPPDRCTSAWS